MQPLMTLQELCDYLKVKKSYVYHLTHTGRIPFIKLGNHIRFRRSDIDGWIENQANETDHRFLIAEGVSYGRKEAR